MLTVFTIQPREALAAETGGALADTPIKAGMMELAVGLGHFAAFPCGQREVPVSTRWSRDRRRDTPSRASRWPFCLTREAIRTQALELVLSRDQALATMLTRPAVTRGAIDALSDTATLQEAIGNVHLLPVDRNLEGENRK